MEKLVIFLIALLLITIGVSSYVIYQNMPGQPQPMVTQLKDPIILKSLGGDIKQFEDDMRFNHNNLTYSFSSDCNQDKKNKMLEAFSTISKDTPITFTEISSDSDISITCSEDSIEKDKNVFIAGEGGPTEFINSTIYPVILKGSIRLYKKSDCKEPVVELHELLHVFGFDHINDSKSIMYPYSDCSQTMSPEYTSYLTKLYSIVPSAELSFESANLTKSGRYLNIQVLISNRGLINAENISLSISTENQIVQTFDLKNINVGMSKKFSAENIRLPSRSTSHATMEIIYSGQEYDKSNNKLNAYLQE